MCTLSWWRGSGEVFEVFFNRDERKTRGRAERPRLAELGGVRYLAPRDPDGGGTWILANTCGVVVCLLNRWHEESVGLGPVRSRGLLVSGMAGMENVPAVEERLRGEDLTQLRPFTLAVFDLVGERGFAWDDRHLSRVELRMPVSSSSYHFDEVDQARRTRFAEMFGRARVEGRDLERFHADGGAAPSAYTVRMCRADAQTMSRSRVRVGRSEVCWDYWEEQPELIGLPAAHRFTMARDGHVGS